MRPSSTRHPPLSGPGLAAPRKIRCSCSCLASLAAQPTAARSVSSLRWTRRPVLPQHYGPVTRSVSRRLPLGLLIVPVRTSAQTTATIRENKYCAKNSTRTSDQERLQLCLREPLDHASYSTSAPWSPGTAGYLRQRLRRGHHEVR